MIIDAYFVFGFAAVFLAGYIIFSK
jgi:hypothetical protein